MASIQNNTADDSGMGFGYKKNGAGRDRIRCDSNRISVRGNGSGGGLRKHVEKRGAKPEILVPLGMGRQMSPLDRPMADQFIILRCGGCWKVGNPCINPSYGIRDICTINRDLITDEEIFRNIRFDPFAIEIFFLHRPPSIAYTPELRR